MIDRIKQHTLKAAQFIKQLLCIHQAHYKGFDPDITVMKSKCPKCGHVDRYTVGRVPVKHQGILV